MVPIQHQSRASHHQDAAALQSPRQRSLVGDISQMVGEAERASYAKPNVEKLLEQSPIGCIVSAGREIVCAFGGFEDVGAGLRARIKPATVRSAIFRK